MKEQDYINVMDLSRVLAIKYLMREITPEDSDVIYRKEYQKIMGILEKWSHELFRQTKITEAK